MLRKRFAVSWFFCEQLLYHCVSFCPFLSRMRYSQYLTRRRAIIMPSCPSNFVQTFSVGFRSTSGVWGYWEHGIFLIFNKYACTWQIILKSEALAHTTAYSQIIVITNNINVNQWQFTKSPVNPRGRGKK